MAVTWNPADKSASITLSNGDLTATAVNSSAKSVRSTFGVSSGKWYWELTRDNASGYDRFGIGTVVASVDATLGDDANSYAYDSYDGYKRYNGVRTAYGDNWFGSGNIIGVALDLDNGKIWFSKNGVWQASGDPAAGTNEAFSGIAGTFYPMLAAFWVDGITTINFGASAFSYSVPTGFSPPDLFIDADVTIPSMTAVGYTGIYSAPSIPQMTAEGFTGIYSAPTIPMMTTVGYTGITAKPSIPMMQANATLSDNIIHIEGSVTIPSMTATITQAKQIWGAVTIPMMTAEITERETVLGAVTIPMMTAELSSGVHADIDVSIPMMTAEGLFGGQCEATIPMMTVEMEGIVGRVGDINVSIPMMTVSITGKTEHLGNINVSVPMMLALAELTTGKIITGAATIPMMTAALSSHHDITGDIDVSIPMMAAYLEGTTARFTSCSVVLRYTEPV